MKLKRRILITAGPTREYLDPVRYLSNDSSGRMGFALAEAAVHLGFAATLIAGPVARPTPHGAKRIDVVTAREMRTAVRKHARQADVVIMAAAVADYRPARPARHKIKKGTGRLTVVLEENPDILAELGHRKESHQMLVGFALETGNLERNARAKLEKKNCDWIVANFATAINARSSRALLLSKDGKRIPLPRLPKEELAVVILSHVLS